ncbi:hypothetical protein [Mucilaginibacter myungsuensis]|uniref:Uncharacterized protein n=1 Tax=Mucilaginibacter myungsuensis TaxID=649104 RepID=A0A929KY20_9SPHI|nr:hypothetical protein [Mucilaginibacter myungsuensis]MBE9662018.1 hypothetical protein [Mucilaginibacter myungsuensis]MDN3599549.1 hypothetical protein [Mucilaginibacter myungsuensis]
MNLQLFISDHLVDLTDSSPIALTFQINNLAEVKNQQGNTSNQFKLPLTQRNRRILGFPDDVAFTNEWPYRQYPAKIVQDGLEIVPNGFAELNGVDNDTASITILSGNVDFFDAIGGKLYEMGDSKSAYGVGQPFKSYEHEWSVANVVASQTKTDGWIWPIVDYGNLTYNQTGQNVIDVRQLRPGFFIKTAIDRMLASVGYTAIGSLMADPLYPKLIAQFSNSKFEHGTDYQNEPDVDGISVTLGDNLVRTTAGEGDDDPMIHWHIRNANALNKQFKAGYVYDSPGELTVSVKLSIPAIYFYGKVTDNESSLVIELVKSHPATGAFDGIASYVVDFSAGYDYYFSVDNGPDKKSFTILKNIVLTHEVELINGDQLAVKYRFEGGDPAEFNMDKNTTWEVRPQVKEVRYGQMIQCERIFPDISQKDLLKDVLLRFGIICQTDANNRQINFASFRDIVGNIPIAKNWSKKCMDQGKSISFKLGNYAQVNRMKCKEDEAILPLGFGDANILVDDKTLPPAADLFESQFAPTLNRPYIGGTIAQIIMNQPGEGSDDFSTGVSPRILVDQKMDLRTKTNRDIKFTDGNAAKDVVVNSWVSVPYFYKPDGEHNLCFGDKPGNGTALLPGLKTRYYPELKKILHRAKKVIRYFLLSPLDILELDLLIPVYLEQDSAYYYINKIDAWQKGKPTKVELVKLE